MPSLDLLRSLSDEHVLGALFVHARLTRTELADLTGISKPTVSDSVGRLVAAGLVHDTGERTTGRGRSGAYFGLSSSLPGALVVSIAPDAVTVECVDARGAVHARSARALPGTTRAATVRRELKAAASEVVSQVIRRPALAVVSAADPVDRTSGCLVHLPDSPFLIGEFDPVKELAAFVTGEVVVDNDVNWAARAEAVALAGTGQDADFTYVHLGSGLGCAVVSDGMVLRGHGGLAGEIAHVLTRDQRGRAVPFTEFFRAAGLRQPTTAAVDVAALVARVEARGRSAEAFCASVGDAVAGVLTAVIALTNPAVVVVGGEWGHHPAVLDATRAALGRGARTVDLQAPRCVAEPAVTGARNDAVLRLRAQLVQSVR